MWRGWRLRRWSTARSASRWRAAPSSRPGSIAWLPSARSTFAPSSSASSSPLAIPQRAKCWWSRGPLGASLASVGLWGALATASCAPGADVAADRAALIRLHELAQTAHLEKRADLLVASFADTCLEIGRGAVTPRSRSENRARFQAYFDRSTFLEWADVSPPIIQISPDRNMAYVIVQKRVRLSALDTLGVPRPEHREFAWAEIYEKRHGRWNLVVVASTDRPGDSASGGRF